MRFFTLILLLSVSCFLHAQSNRYLKLSGGKVFFGVGDVPSYGVYVEYAAQLGKQKDGYLKHFQFGGELGFEAGTTEPETINPSLSNYLSKVFYHYTSSQLFAKLSYYPINKTFLKGLNVGIGPTAGYVLRSEEWRSELVVSGGDLHLRNSNLKYYDYAFIGYRISAGYEYYFKKIIIGARLDWSNNQKGDINTMYGGKVGFKL